MAIIVLTGTPGTGKSVLAKAAAKALGKGTPILNDASFAKRMGIGKINSAGELEVPIPELKRKVGAWLKGKKNAVLEGHLFCEAGFNANLVFVLRVKPETIAKRLRKGRRYPEAKVLDNAMAEADSYCLRRARKNYPKKIVRVVSNESSLNSTRSNIAAELKKIQKTAKSPK